jgi:chromosome condensin MukBEF ATPase and DNA-binding subunit MukB
MRGQLDFDTANDGTQHLGDALRSGIIHVDDPIEAIDEI